LALAKGKEEAKGAAEQNASHEDQAYSSAEKARQEAD
jgi:hypothetical protein